MLSRPVQAALAAAALALASTAPAVVWAADPHHGGGRLHDSNPSDPTVDPPGAEPPAQDAPPDPEPPADPPDEPGPGAGTSPAPEPTADPTEPSDPVEGSTPDLPAPEPTPSPEPAPPPAAAPAPPSASAAAPALRRGAHRLQRQRHVMYKPRRAPSATSTVRITPARAARAAPHQALARAAAPASRTTFVATFKHARAGEHWHAVRQGETLWSIARDQLGDQVTTARIAHEVARLWEVNRERIGTGDPDLVMVGTRLRLA